MSKDSLYESWSNYINLFLKDVKEHQVHKGVVIKDYGDSVSVQFKKDSGKMLRGKFAKWKFEPLENLERGSGVDFYMWEQDDKKMPFGGIFIVRKPEIDLRRISDDLIKRLNKATENI